MPGRGPVAKVAQGVLCSLKIPDILHLFLRHQPMTLIQDSAFLNALEGLQDFVLNTNADCDMAYDWICDQAECYTLAYDTPAWHLFFETFLGAKDNS